MLPNPLIREIKEVKFLKRSVNKQSGQSKKKASPKNAPKKSYKKAPPKDQRFPSAREDREKKEAKAHPLPNLWGIHAFRAAWLNPRRHIREVWLSPNSAKELHDTINTRMDVDRPHPKIMTNDAFRDLFVGRDGTHQSAALWGEALIQPTFEDWIATSPNRVVILDQVTDPHNVGAILRSACAFGFDGLVMQDRHAPPVTGTLAKIASGAVDHTPILSVVNVVRAIDQLKEEGFFVIGLAEEEATDFASLPTYDKVALVMGAEGDGVRQAVRKACDMCVALPTQGAIKSLNVSAAASAAMMGLLK